MFGNLISSSLFLVFIQDPVYDRVETLTLLTEIRKSVPRGLLNLHSCFIVSHSYNSEYQRIRLIFRYTKYTIWKLNRLPRTKKESLMQ